MSRKLIMLLLLLPLGVMAQNRITVEEYIEAYKDIAMKEMKNHKIPASITLAQGIVESGAGNSTLAKKANNHFGIKCHGWTGDTYTMDDDAKDECFRKYRKAEDSYKDHSEFLTTRSRYAPLFELDIMDYEGWANGLKAAGYATNPSYATALINRIKMSKLYLYDQLAMGLINEKELKRRMEDANEKPIEVKSTAIELAFCPEDRTPYQLVDMTEDKRFIYENNHTRFVYAKEGETLESISKEFGIKMKKLCTYNIITRPEEVVFHHGDVVYLEKLSKKNRSVKRYYAVGGETVRDIALRFAVRPEKIMKRNKLDENAVIKPGQKIKLK